MTRQHGKDLRSMEKKSAGRLLRDGAKEAIAAGGDDDAPFDGGTVVERAWHVLEYRPAEDRTYYLGPTLDNTPVDGRAFLTPAEFRDWLEDSDTVTCELEK